MRVLSREIEVITGNGLIIKFRQLLADPDQGIGDRSISIVIREDGARNTQPIETIDIERLLASIAGHLEARSSQPPLGSPLAALWAKLDKVIDTDTDMSVRACIYLKKVRVKYIGELVQIPEAKLRGDKRLARKCLSEISGILADMGLMLGMLPGQILNWQRPDQRGKGGGMGDDV